MTQIPPPGGLEVNVESTGPTAVVELIGELDLATRELVVEALGRLEQEKVEKLVIDLRRLSFIDCTGVSALLAAQGRARRGRIELSLRPGPRAVQRVFGLVGLDRELPFGKE